MGVSLSQGPWAPGGDSWSQSNNEMGNSTSGADGDQPFFHFDNIISLLMVLVSLCGAVGNGAVVWLLWISRKKSRFSIHIRGIFLKGSPFSLYILILALFDGAFLLVNGILYTLLLLQHELQGWGNLWVLLQLIRLGLLVAGSTVRWASGPCPIRKQWPYGKNFSLDLFLLISGLAVCLVVSELVCERVGAPCDGLDWVYVLTVVVTLLVLCVSSLTLLVQVQCRSRGTRPCRFHVIVLLTVLVFLLLGLPYTVYVLVLTIAPDTEYVPGLGETLGLLFILNHVVNPIIYFFVGRYRRRLDRTPTLRGAPEGAKRRRQRRRRRRRRRGRAERSGRHPALHKHHDIP